MFFSLTYGFLAVVTITRLLLRRNTPLRETYFIMLLLVVSHGAWLAWEVRGMDVITSRLLFESTALALMLITLLVHRFGEGIKISLFTWPLAVSLMVLAVSQGPKMLLRDELRPHMHSIFIHISLGLLGYGSFFLLTLASLLYLWQRNMIKNHKNVALMNFLPSMLQLESIQSKSLYAGIVVFTLAIGLGKLSPYLWGVPHAWRSKEILTVVIWTIYFILGFVRHFSRSQRHIFAYSALSGLVLVVISFFILDVHDASQAAAAVQGGGL